VVFRNFLILDHLVFSEMFFWICSSQDLKASLVADKIRCVFKRLDLIVANTSQVFDKFDKHFKNALNQLQNYFELKYGYWFTLPYSLAQIYHFPKAKDMWQELTNSSHQQKKSWDLNGFLAPQVQQSLVKFVTSKEPNPCIQNFQPLYEWFMETFGALALHNNGQKYVQRNIYRL
jgi:hypothetical protein